MEQNFFLPNFKDYLAYSRICSLVLPNRNLIFVELNRTESLKRDLEFFYGKNWSDKISPSPVTKKYLQL